MYKAHCEEWHYSWGTASWPTLKAYLNGKIGGKKSVIFFAFFTKNIEIFSVASKGYLNG